jgi:hypothetical protein
LFFLDLGRFFCYSDYKSFKHSGSLLTLRNDWIKNRAS